MAAELTSGTGLIGRCGLNEGTGTVATNSVAGRPNGTLTNGPVWVVPPDTTAAGPAAEPRRRHRHRRVTVAWSANTEADLAGYNVYRATSSPVATTGTPLNGGTLLTTPIYTDTTAANAATYVYVVTAVDTAGNQSAASTEVPATPKASPEPACSSTGRAST